MHSFFSRDEPSLKICGITQLEKAKAMASLGVDAMGVNFWSGSKRFIPPGEARRFLEEVDGQILRIGLFVNQGIELPQQLFDNGLIDAVQLHGDETMADAISLANSGVPVIKAFNIEASATLDVAKNYGIQAALLDTPAPGAYGGTGKSFDWDLAVEFRKRHRKLPMILAGGINADNAAAGLEQVAPCALDVASGAESEPGVQDLKKVEALLKIVRDASY